LYEQLDNLSSSADIPGAEALASAALELTVYLSSLVESGTNANPVQRERARSLLQTARRGFGCRCGNQRSRLRRWPAPVSIAWCSICVPTTANCPVSCPVGA
jgi:hypothetical protein